MRASAELPGEYICASDAGAPLYTHMDSAITPRMRKVCIAMSHAICANTKRQPGSNDLTADIADCIHFLTADISSIIGRRISSFMPAMSIMSAGGCGSITCVSSKPFASSVLR